MARFDLHRRRDGPGFLLNLQHEYLDHLPTRLVCPVTPAPKPLPALGALTPPAEIEGRPYLVFPQYLAAIPRRELGRPVGSLEAERDAITRALDLLFTGF